MNNIEPHDIPTIQAMHLEPDMFAAQQHQMMGLAGGPPPPPPSNDTKAATSGPGRKKKGKKRDTLLRKNPDAPKRFKSSYICFFQANQSKIKEELGDKANVTSISKRSAELWRELPADQRAHWDDLAAKDKQRFMREKANYTGPWQIPFKRSRKDPSAPKRPMSAFLHYSLGKRQELKKEHPDMKNTDISRLLGENWRKLSEEGRKPHVDHELAEREKYKVAMSTWREENLIKVQARLNAEEEQRKFYASQSQQQQQQGDNPYPISISQQEGEAHTIMYGDSSRPLATQLPHMGFSHPPAGYFSGSAVPYNTYGAPQQFQFPAGSARPGHPVLLSAAGIPYSQLPQQQSSKAPPNEANTKPSTSGDNNEGEAPEEPQTDD